MSKRKILRGTTSVTVPVFIQSTVDGSGLSGLTSASAGLVCKYRRHAASTWGTITLSAGTLGTWSSGGFVADTNGPAGMYELGIPDAALTNNSWVIIALYGAANMAPVMMEFELDAINYQDGVRLGLTALPNLAAGANGGLPLSMDTNGRVDVGEWLGVAPNALTSGRVDSSVGVITANAITATAITNGALVGAKFGDGFISSTKIADNTITSSHFVAGAIDAGAIATGAITANKFAAGAISSSTFGAGAINAAAIATNAITSAKIATDAIGSAQLATDAITSAQIAASAVTKIQSGLSTYAGSDTAGTTTLLSRLTSTRAGNLDNLDTAVSGVPLATWNILRSVTFGVGSIGEKFKVWMADLGSDNRVKVTADAHTSGETIAAVSGDTKQTGDAYARIGSNGAGLTALGDTRLANLDATISSRNATTPPTVAAIRAELDSNSTKLANLDATISSRSTYAGTDTSGTTTLLARLTSTRAGLLDNLDAAVSTRLALAGYTAPDNATISTLASRLSAARALLLDNLDDLDAAVSSRSTYAGTDTSGTTTLLTRLPSTLTVTAGKVDVNDKTGFALTTDEHEAIAEAVESGAGGEVTEAGVASAVRTELATELGRIDVAISTRNSTTPPTAAAIRTELDTNSTKLANLDTTVSSRNATTPPTVAAIRAEMDSNSTKLANLDATISSRSTYNGADTTGTSTLLSRLTSIRAGLLDNLDAAISSITVGDNASAEDVALAVREELAAELANLDAAISTRSTYAGSDTSGTTTLLTRLSSDRATNLDNLDAPISEIESGSGGENSGVTTLLERLTETRATNLDNLDMPISDLPTADEVGDELVGVTVGSVVI